MPVYSYRCQICGNESDVRRAVDERNDNLFCTEPNCIGITTRVFNPKDVAITTTLAGDMKSIRSDFYPAATVDHTAEYNAKASWVNFCQDSHDLNSKVDKQKTDFKELFKKQNPQYKCDGTPLTPSPDIKQRPR